jgi:hypothetical protein
MILLSQSLDYSNTFTYLLNMKEREMNLEKEREPIRVAHQLVETKYESRQDFIERAKLEIKRNFEAFVKNEKPDPKEYKAVGLDGVVFGDFPDKNHYNYEVAFDFQDWKTPEQMVKDLESTLQNLFDLIGQNRMQKGIITVHLVHYM